MSSGERPFTSSDVTPDLPEAARISEKDSSRYPSARCNGVLWLSSGIERSASAATNACRIGSNFMATARWTGVMPSLPLATDEEPFSINVSEVRIVPLCNEL
eukprot:GDKJ01027942.1.p2 GENE.GDKJ01027942.1~~GDKJ01027942.1.p2  ORF type:complete len:102 (+),score=12.79 GDKJ01027942.1:140-445(+)